MWILIGSLGGGVATFVAQKTLLKKDAERIIKEAETKAETIQKERALQAKERFKTKRRARRSHQRSRTKNAI